MLFFYLLSFKNFLLAWLDKNLDDILVRIGPLDEIIIDCLELIFFRTRLKA